MFKCPNCSALRLIPSRQSGTNLDFVPRVEKSPRINGPRSGYQIYCPALRDYHHLVFTIPWQLRAIILLNRAVIFNILFSAAALSLLSWTKESGGYIPGIDIVLHTFGSDIKFHPHLHILITPIYHRGLSLDHQKCLYSYII